MSASEEVSDTGSRMCEAWGFVSAMVGSEGGCRVRPSLEKDDVATTGNFFFFAGFTAR
jgi:hypothetical protein